MSPERRAVASVLLIIALLFLGIGVPSQPSGPIPPDGPSKRLVVSTLDLTGAPGTVILRGVNMVPGDVAVGVVTIANPGRAAMRYRMTAGAPAPGDELAAQLTLTIKTVGSSCDDFDGTPLFDGSFPDAAFGNDAVGGRELRPATAEILCFRALLPLSAGNELQGSATALAFTFDAQ